MDQFHEKQFNCFTIGSMLTFAIGKQSNKKANKHVNNASKHYNIVKNVLRSWLNSFQAAHQLKDRLAYNRPQFVNCCQLALQANLPAALHASEVRSTDKSLSP